MAILLQEGFIKRDSRFREKGGQTSNLYTLCCPSNTSGEVKKKELNPEQEKAEDNSVTIQCHGESDNLHSP